MLPISVSVPERQAMSAPHVSLPSSRELAALFQEEFATVTGLPARWAAEKLQGNTLQLEVWEVPFYGEQGLRGAFRLRWDPGLSRLLSARVGSSAQRPEFLGAILRGMAGRWASWQALRHGSPVRLLPSPEAPAARPEGPWCSSAALLVDQHALELSCVLESGQN
jgi:hypothetical protein